MKALSRTSHYSLAVLAAFLIGAYTANLSAATFSDDNWISMGGIPGVDGWNVEVHAAAVDDFGNLYIGGEFTIAGEVFATNIAKWDGSRWSALGSGINGDVVTLLVSGNNLYAGGLFTTAGGVSATNIARWDGTNWSALGLGMDGEVRALAVSGSDLYAGGGFTNADGDAANYVAKWNGSSWISLGSGLDNWASSLAVSGGDLQEIAWGRTYPLNIEAFSSCANV